MPEPAFVLSEFRDRLAETSAWCEGRGRVDDPAGSLRTLMAPSPFLLDREWVVATIHARRREVLDRARPTDLAAGRLLAYDPNQNLFDAAASLASRGFFDDDNVPPWDTWVDYFREGDEGSDHFAEYLVSWVPPEFLGLAAAGVEANPEQCIAWLTDVPALRDGSSHTAESITEARLAGA